MFVSRPHATKGKTSPILTRKENGFPADDDSECSASLSGLLTYTIAPCTPSPSISCCQLAPPALSLLAAELTSRRSLRVPPPPPVVCVPGAPPPARPTPPPLARAPGFACSQVCALPPPSLCSPFPPKPARVPPAHAPDSPPPGTCTAVAAAFFPLSPAAHVSVAAATARDPCPGTTYVAAPVTTLTPQPSKHQPLPPDTLPGTSTLHCQPSSYPPPPKETSCHFFIYLHTPQGSGIINI
jgi:hypothetical protein